MLLLVFVLSFCCIIKKFLMCKNKDHASFEIIEQLYVQAIVFFDIAFKNMF
jgi:hypothetical protein